MSVKRARVMTATKPDSSCCTFCDISLGEGFDSRPVYVGQRYLCKGCADGLEAKGYLYLGPDDYPHLAILANGRIEVVAASVQHIERLNSSVVSGEDPHEILKEVLEAKR